MGSNAAALQPREMRAEPVGVGGVRGARKNELARPLPASAQPRGLCRAPGAGLGCGSPGPSLRWGEQRRTGPQPITHQAGAGTAPGLPGSTSPEPNPARVRAAVPDPRVSEPAPPHRGGRARGPALPCAGAAQRLRTPRCGAGTRSDPHRGPAPLTGTRVQRRVPGLPRAASRRGRGGGTGTFRVCFQFNKLPFGAPAGCRRRGAEPGDAAGAAGRAARGRALGTGGASPESFRGGGGAMLALAGRRARAGLGLLQVRPGPGDPGLMGLGSEEAGGQCGGVGGNRVWAAVG